MAAEVAGKAKEKISKKHIDAAREQLQKDRINLMLSSASYHLRLTAAALARITYLTEEVWHSTSTLYDQYRHIMTQDSNLLTYRRFSELLTELENMGLVTSHTSSRGRHGYGTQYKLVVPPEAIGKACFPPDWWSEIVWRKKEHDRNEDSTSIFRPGRGRKSSGLFNDNLFDSLFSSKRMIAGSSL